MPSIRAANRSYPEIQSLLLVTALWKAAAVLLGGILADVFRSRRLLQLALLALAAASLGSIVFPTGIGFFAMRVISTLSVGMILPFVIGAVGTVYSGKRRATAIGLTYSGLAAAGALAPALALLNGPDGPFAPAFAVCAVIALIALVVNRRMLPPLPAARVSQRPVILATALWAFGVTAIVAALVNFRIDPLDGLVIVVGALALGGAILTLRRNPSRDGEPINLRPVAIVLAVGIVIGFAQVIPLLKVPQFFQLAQEMPPLLATLAIAPFAVALLLSGPLSGWLVTRVSPRVLVAGGVAAIGVADLVLAAILVPNTSYILFILPFVLVGAGFVIATVVRTAIIFASVPAEMPGSAAALNEASLGLGGRLGIVFSTSVATQVALQLYGNTLGGLPTAEAEQRLAALRELLFALGLPTFPQLLELVDPQTRTIYTDAALAGVRVALIVPGVIAVVTGILAFVLVGPRDPINSVWDYRDERGRERDGVPARDAGS